MKPPKKLPSFDGFIETPYVQRNCFHGYIRIDLSRFSNVSAFLEVQIVTALLLEDKNCQWWKVFTTHLFWVKIVMGILFGDENYYKLYFCLGNNSLSSLRSSLEIILINF